ncbi:MAG: ABC transporter substrate-binding protein [Bacteroidota bacterium]
MKLSRLARHLLLVTLSIVFIEGKPYVSAQEEFMPVASVNPRFEEALRYYHSGNYAQASAIFNSLLDMRPLHQYTTASYVMAAKSFFNMRNYDRSSSLLKNFLAAYPKSKYADNAFYTLGLCYIMEHQDGEAALALLRAKENSPDSVTVDRSQTLLEYLAQGDRVLVDLQNFPQNGETLRTRDYMTYLKARHSYAEGDFGNARKLVDALLASNPGSDIGNDALALKIKIGDGVRLKIGALLPLFHTGASPAKSLAMEMLEGMKYALEVKNQSLPEGLKILLDAKDVASDTGLAKQMLKELAEDNEVVGILGPMFSNIAFELAGVADEEKIPLISPTANAHGIAGKSPFMFQLNPDLELHGKALARYAVSTLGLKTLAIIAPSDPGVKPLVDEFYNEAIRDGARIITVEIYSNASDDLEDHFQKLRKAGLGGEPRIAFSPKMPNEQADSLLTCGIPQSGIDSLKKLKTSISVFSLLGVYGLQIAESKHIPISYPAVNARDLNIVLDGIDGLFAPVADPENINILLSQIAYYNIKTQILGSAEWYDINMLESNKQTAKGVIFCSDTYVAKDNPDVRKFGKEYFDKTGKSPSRYAMFGYDAMELLMTLIAKGNNTREKLDSALMQVEGFQGLHSNIRIDSSRVNSVLNILQYKNGVVKKIGEVSER